MFRMEISYEEENLLFSVNRNPDYEPFCLRCIDLVHMKKEKHLLWKCSVCSSVVDIRHCSPDYIKEVNQFWQIFFFHLVREANRNVFMGMDMATSASEKEVLSMARECVRIMKCTCDCYHCEQTRKD